MCVYKPPVYPWQQGLRLSLWTLTCSSQKYLPLQENWVAQGPDGRCSHTLTLKLLIQGKAGSNWKLFQSRCQSGPSQVRKLCQKTKLVPLMKGLAANSKTALASSFNRSLIQGCVPTSQWETLYEGSCTHCCFCCQVVFQEVVSQSDIFTQNNFIHRNAC